jgi:hypothetical protein
MCSAQLVTNRKEKLMARLRQYFLKEEKQEAKAAAKERGQSVFVGKGKPKDGGRFGIVFYYVGSYPPVNPGRFFADNNFTVNFL